MVNQNHIWRKIAPGVLLPSALQAISYGAVLPIVAVYAHDDLGASLAFAGLVSALLLVGQLLGNVPSGWVVDRLGERNAMYAAAGINIAALIGCALSTRPEPLAACALLIGVSNAVFGLARQALVTVVVPQSFRARAFSLMAGAYRLGFLIGPFLGAAALSLTGSMRAGFAVAVIAVLATIVAIMLIPDPETLIGMPAPPANAPRPPLLRTFRDSRRVLWRVGFAALAVSAMRASRNTLLPLWATSLGMDATSIALVVGVGAAIDFSLFYVGGMLMDRYGRTVVGVLTLVSYGVGHVTLALTHSTPFAVGVFLAVVVMFAVTDGFCSGIIMTTGADMADMMNPNRPAVFLAAWRLVTDVGSAGSPLAISFLTGVAGLSLAAAAVGMVGFAGAFVLGRYGAAVMREAAARRAVRDAALAPAS
ncbi:MAG: MFS transporter [Chloroflexi bacterium]|nr:MFS transporter [Chloroflexota bacterium]